LHILGSDEIAWAKDRKQCWKAQFLWMASDWTFPEAKTRPKFSMSPVVSSFPALYAVVIRGWDRSGGSVSATQR